jgi:FKBP-type peptidyl-prolyl cis-trans isomerase (trigger factor)
MLIKKSEVKKLDACKRQVHVEIPKEIVDKKLEEVLSDINKKASVKGFRPGRAPRYVIENKHGNLAREEAIKDLISDSYQEVIEKECLNPIDLPEIFDVELKEGVLYYKAKVDIKPEVQIKDYRGLTITRKEIKVTPEDIQKAVEYLKANQGLDKAAPADDAFAKGMGYPSLKDLEESIGKQLEVSKEQMARSEMESQLIDQLIKKADLILPESAVKKQLEHLWHDTQHRMSAQGMKKEDIEAKAEEFKKELKEMAERDIRVYFIFDKIAQQEKIQSDKPELTFKKVLEFLMKEANWQEGGTDGK